MKGLPPYQTALADLSGTFPILEEHVATIALMIGHFEELNSTAGQKDFAEGARRGAAALRNSTLRGLLVASCASFAVPSREDDISFRRYDAALADIAFVDYCAKSTGRYVGPVRQMALEFRNFFSNALPHYDAVKKMRDKSIAHLSRESFPPPLISDILELGRASVAMAEHLAYVIGAHDLTISTLYGNGKMHVKALRRAERPKSLR